MGSFLFDRVQESMPEPFRGFTRPPAKKKPFHTMEAPGRVSPYNLSFSWRKKEGRRREELLRKRFYRTLLVDSGVLCFRVVREAQRML